MRLLAALLLAAGLGVASTAGCGTDAVGVDDCRQIEQTRCDYAVACGLTDDAEACRRFYRDQCLHGLAGGQPSRLELGVCLRTIRAAGACAKEDREQTLDVCASDTKSGPVPVCDVISAPERLVECDFLASVPVEPFEAGADADGRGDGSGGDAAAE